MLKKLFKKELPIEEVFLEELLKKTPNISMLNEMISNKELDIDTKNEKGETFLHLTLKAKKVQNALWLISKGISLDTIDDEGISAFDLAINNQNHRIVKHILDKIKIDLNKPNEYGRTILQDSVILGDHEMAKLLISNGANINIKNNKNRTVLYDALSYNNEEFTNYLLGFDELELNTIDIEKNTIFDHKSVKENYEIAKILIEKGADPTIQNKKGENFLYYCVLDGIDGLEVINFAIEQGYDINSKVKKDDTMFMVLIDELLNLKDDKDEEKKKIIRFILKELITKGLNINSLCTNGENALFRSIRANDEELVKLLISMGIEVNIQNNDKQTPLATAVYQGTKSLKIIIDLLKYKADPTVKNNDEKCLFEEINDMILDIEYPKQVQMMYEQKLETKHLSAQFVLVLKELLKYCKKDLNYLDSMGNPLFYKSLMFHNISLFYLYANKGLNLHNLNKNGHNLFFEYLVKVFEEDNENIDFQGVLNILISFKINHNKQDETGWTAVSKIIATTPCNLNLFKILIKVIKFDYTIADKLGRTAMHSAVWKGNSNVVKIINFIDSSVKNKTDNYGILPITYAALLGNQELVLTFTSLKSISTTDFYILPAAIKKFTPLLSNLDKLTLDINDPQKLKQLDTVIEDVKNDFKEKDKENI